VVTARAASGEAKQEVDVAEGEKKQIQLVIAAGGGAPSTPGEETSAPPPQPQAGSESETKVHSPNALTWTGVVVGGAGIATAAITGLMSISTTSKLKNECPNKVCPPGPGQSDYNSASSLATISTVSFVVGLAGAGVAVASLLIGHSAPTAEAPAQTPTETGGEPTPPAPAPESRLHVTPWVGFGSAGVFGTF
jgi:hypothetical protein